MRIEAFGLLFMVTMAANAGESSATPVAIHLRETHKVDLLLLRRAKAIVSTIFDTAGIRVVWKMGAPSPAQSCCATVLQFETSTPANFRPAALARAFPFADGSRAISILYDRISKIKPRPDIVLAHVIVHEVTHMLQGIDRHSETGIMRPYWSGEDFGAMERSTLSFTPDDVNLIHLGLRRRMAASMR